MLGNQHVHPMHGGTCFRARDFFANPHGFLPKGGFVGCKFLFTHQSCGPTYPSGIETPRPRFSTNDNAITGTKKESLSLHDSALQPAWHPRFQSWIPHSPIKQLHLPCSQRNEIRLKSALKNGANLDHSPRCSLGVCAPNWRNLFQPACPMVARRELGDQMKIPIRPLIRFSTSRGARSS